MRNDFEKAMNFRHACKLFDDTKKIAQEDLDFILEVGRMSPSSCGMEQWKFLVVRDENIKAAIRQVAWNQPQITTCSELVVVLYKKQLRSNTQYAQAQMAAKTVKDSQAGATQTKEVIAQISNISDLAMTNARSVEEIAAATEHLAHLSENLSSLLAKFETK